MAVSFWPIMYARFGVRHIGTLPWMLMAFYLLYPSPRPSPLQGEGAARPRVLWKSEGRVVLAGICLAAGLMTYFAGRAVPLILAGFLGYLLIFQRSLLKHVWWRYALAIAIGLAIAAPMFVEIANTPGAEKRTEVVGGPLTALLKGNVQPAIDTTLGTLGMFTFAGDPESLYNVPGRPVFDWITGAFFYLGVLICLIRLKRVESGFALAWLIIGIAPAFVSVPAASFSHTIAALPVVYMIAAVGVVTMVDKMTRWHASRDTMTSRQKIILSSLHPEGIARVLRYVILSGVVLLNGAFTLRDYFGTWANDPFVRFQYHAPTREIAEWLEQNPSMTVVAIGTNPNELFLDPLALQLDLRHPVIAGWFDAESALMLPTGKIVLVSAMQDPSNEVRDILDTLGEKTYQGAAFTAYRLQSVPDDIPPLGAEFDQGALSLRAALRSEIQAKSGQSILWRTNWNIAKPVSQPRLKMFLHVLNGQSAVVVGDDRDGVNFATVQAGDQFWQISRVTLPSNLASGKYAIEIGWYQPETGARLKLADGSDRFLLAPLEVVAP